jgi:hypothetical protein
MESEWINSHRSDLVRDSAVTDSLFRPLAVDVAAAVAPILAGLLALYVGRSLTRWPGWGQLLAVLGSVAVLALGIAEVAGILPPTLSRGLIAFGGGTIVCCVVAAFLLGAAIGSPRVSFSSNFLFSIFGIASVLLLIEGSGRLYWRFGAPGTWVRFADADGKLRQTTGMTCEPTAAVMLLHAAGVKASEGEMAYRSGTSLFGTDAHSVAAAISNKVRPLGLRAENAVTTYEAMLHQGRPAIVHIHPPGGGGHAVFVEVFTPDGVILIDPADGKRYALPREDFVRIWDGTAVWLTPREG